MTNYFNRSNYEPNWMPDFDDIDNHYINDEIIKDSFKDFKKPLSPKPIIHTCKDGRKVCLNYDKPYGQDVPKMTNSHLLNTIAFLKRKAKEGVIVKFGGGSTADDMWYGEDTVYGKEAKELLNYYVYKSEAISRGLIKKK